MHEINEILYLKLFCNFDWDDLLNCLIYIFSLAARPFPPLQSGFHPEKASGPSLDSAVCNGSTWD